jgi:hypothetical protein
VFFALWARSGPGAKGGILFSEFSTALIPCKLHIAALI